MKKWINQYNKSVYSELSGLTPDLYEYLIQNGKDFSDKSWNEILTIFKKTIRPRSNMPIDVFTERFRFLSSQSSAVPGKFDVSRYEVARGPLRSIATEKGVRKITAIGPTQLYKSTLLECTALYFAIIDPKPMLLVQPNWNDALDFMSDKVQPMFDSSPIAKNSVYKMTKTSVLFTGGHLKLASAKSEASLASRLAGAMLFDEIKSYEPIAGRYATDYGEKRLETYRDFGRSIAVSSPKGEDNLAWKRYLSGDRRQAFVKCPHCGHDHIMRWKKTEYEQEQYIKKWQENRPGEALPENFEYNVKWSKDSDTNNVDYSTAHYHCPECETEWSYGDRLKALDRFKVIWKQTKPFTCCKDKPLLGGGYQDPLIEQNWEYVIDPYDGFIIVGRAKCKCCGKLAVPNTHASFQTSRLYSSAKLDFLVEKWIDAQKIVGGIQSFVNDELGEPWKEVSFITISAEGLMAREEDYEDELPARSVVITAGVDSHPDRFEVEIVAWGRNFESWTLDYIVVPGKPDANSTHIKLNEVLSKKYKRPDGRKQGIQAVCIDSGGQNENTQDGTRTTMGVYKFCIDKIDRNIWPVKGKSEAPNEVADAWPHNASTSNSYKIPLYVIGTTQLKNEVHNLLKKKEPGPGYAHFKKGRFHDWYIGLLSEVKYQPKPGLPYRWKVKDKSRNEPLDCRVYALAALEGLKSKYKNPNFVEQLAEQMNIPFEFTEFEKSIYTKEVLETIDIETERAILNNNGLGKKKKNQPGQNSAITKKKEELERKLSEVEMTGEYGLKYNKPGRVPPLSSAPPSRVPVPSWRKRT